MESELWDPAAPASTALGWNLSSLWAGWEGLLLDSDSWMTLCFSLSMMFCSCGSPGLCGQGWSCGPSDIPREAFPQNRAISKRWQYKIPLHNIPTKPITALYRTLNSVVLIWVVSSSLEQLAFPLALSLESLFEVNYCKNTSNSDIWNTSTMVPYGCSSLHKLQGREVSDRWKMPGKGVFCMRLKN